MTAYLSIYIYRNIYFILQNVNEALSPESSLHLMIERERKFSIHSEEEGNIQQSGLSESFYNLIDFQLHDHHHTLSQRLLK